MERIGIIGGGRFGTTLAMELTQKGGEVLFMDKARDVVQRLSGVVAKAVQGDATDIEALSEAGFGACETVVVAIGSNVEASILATMALKDLRVARIIAKASTDTHGKVLERVGVNQIIYPERERASRLARTLAAQSIIDYIEVAEGTGIIEIQAPPMFQNKTLSEANIRGSFGLTVLAIYRAAGESGRRQTLQVPAGSDLVHEGDVLVLFGPDDKIRDLENAIA